MRRSVLAIADLFCGVGATLLASGSLQRVSPAAPSAEPALAASTRPLPRCCAAGSLLSPSPDAAVVGGNVLTSQRVTDVVLRAFNAAAASQASSGAGQLVQGRGPSLDCACPVFAAAPHSKPPPTYDHRLSIAWCRRCLSARSPGTRHAQPAAKLAPPAGPHDPPAPPPPPPHTHTHTLTPVVHPPPPRAA
jgi:hypothetical protein